MESLSKESFWDFAAKQGLLCEGDFVVAAVSGGADSSALLHLLWSLREEKRLSLLCAHVNHNLRGAESQRDENFVRALCEKYEIPCRVLSADVAKAAAQSGKSCEEAGRDIRYSFFEECAEEFSSKAKIATAHNLTDCVETYIFNSARGASLGGLCGIPLKRGNIVRPLLNFSRNAVEDYCAENGLEFVTDSTNLTDDYSRNRIRHNVLPVLRELNPDFESAFRRLFENLREDCAFLEGLAAEKTELSMDAEGRFDAKGLAGLSAPLKKRAAAEILLRLGFGQSFERVSLLAESFGVRNFKTELSKDAYLVQRDGFVFREEKPVFEKALAERPFSEGEFLLEGEKKVKISVLPAEEFKSLHKVNHFALEYTFDCDKIHGSAFLRSRRTGDKINIHGGTKTLKKLFNERKVPPEKRSSALVIADEQGVIWAEHAGADVRARLSAETERVVLIEI